MSDPFDWLFGLEQFGIKFGLDNITAMVDALGRPQLAYRSVHVAGTNGKGSVTAMVDTALRAAGHRVARYTSPHLLDLAERFVVDGRPIDRDTLGRTVSDVREVVEQLRGRGRLEVHPTFFEATTAVAFEAFRRAGVDLAVCEVGLGGRLDATNVLTPEVAAITSIGLDHEQYLGHSVREIAIEKAGIVKPGIPIVVGRMDRLAFETIAGVARERGAPLHEATISRYGHVGLGLRGAHQRDNAAVAVTLLETLGERGVSVPPAAVVRGLEDTSWPGRLDIRRLADGREALLDAAHNPDGARALAEFLRTSPFKDAPLVFGAMRDKNVSAMLEALAPVVSAVVTTRAGTGRAADADELAAIVRTLAPHLPVTATSSAADALAAAWQRSRRIVVAGSIVLVGDAMKAAHWS